MGEELLKRERQTEKRSRRNVDKNKSFYTSHI